MILLCRAPVCIRSRIKRTMTEHTAIVPLIPRMVRWSNEAETLHTLEDAPLEQSGSASGLGRICPLTFWRKRPAVKPGAFITKGIFLNVSWLWERHVRPSWGYGLSARSGGVGRPLGRLMEFAFWPNVCVLASYRNYTPFYWCMLFSLTPMGPIIAGVCG